MVSIKGVAKAKVARRDATACSVSGCQCESYVQPNTGTACARQGCGHSQEKHTG